MPENGAVNRKLVVGKKVVGGLPKEKAPRKKWHVGVKKLLLSPEEETLEVKLYGRETDKYPLVFVDMDAERVLGIVTLTTTLNRSPVSTAWHPISGPGHINFVATRHTLITRCTCTLPVALAALRQDSEQNLRINEVYIAPGNSVSVMLPDPLITFR